MSKQGESKLSAKIMHDLRMQGYFCFKVHGSALMMTGLPDIIVCAEGLFIGLETKMPGKRNDTSPKQDLVHDEIRDAKGYCTVICSSVEALEYVADVLKDRKKLRVNSGLPIN